MRSTNFKTYESQSRLLAAVIASAPELKLNFKEIAKFFGESTAQGLEFQFRSVKANARKLQEVANAGGDTATALDGNPSTPRKRKAAGSATATPTPKRAKKVAPKIELLSDDDDNDCDDEDANFDELDNKPRARAKSKTPRVSQASGTVEPEAAPTGLFSGQEAVGGVGTFPLQHSVVNNGVADDDDGEC